MMKIQLSFVAALFLFFSVSMALACGTEGRFNVNSDGTVTDTQTGLTWKRCLEGQTFSSETCNESAEKPTWSGALAKTTDVWRVPNIKELQSLVDETKHNPAINTTCFPTPAGQQPVWSASPYAEDTTNSWVIDFQYGIFFNNIKQTSTVISVRLVRD
jgi:hypothetical protein